MRPGWYNTEWHSNPKSSFVADLAAGEGMWDRRIECGACDLHWSPGWSLEKGWFGNSWSLWPDPAEYHELQQRRARLPAHLQ